MNDKKQPKNQDNNGIYYPLKSTNFILKLIRLNVLLFLIVLAFSTSTIAQNSVFGGVVGIVRENLTGAPISGATVDVVNVDTQQVEFNLVTDSRGIFYREWFLPGNYLIIISASGYERATRRFTLYATRLTQIFPPIVLQRDGSIIQSTNTIDSGREGFNQGKQKAELVVQTGHTSSVKSVAYSPNGKIIASGSSSTVKLWDVATGQELRILRGHTSFVNSVVFSPDGKIIASGSSDETVRLWDVERGQNFRTFKGHTSPVNSVAFSPDGKTVASGSRNSSIKLWDVASGQEFRTLVGYTKTVNPVTFSFSPDGKTLLSGSRNSTIKLWNVRTGKEIHTFNGRNQSVQSVAYSPDGKTVAFGGRDFFKLWNVVTDQEVHTFEHTPSVFSVAYSPDGKIIASGGINSVIDLWNVATGQKIRTLDGHSSHIESVAFSPDGKTIASGSKDKTVKLWNVATGQELRTLSGHSSHIESVAFSLDGKQIISGNWDKTVKLWNVEGSQKFRTFKGHASVVYSVAFSPDGKTVASGSWDKTVKLWNVASGQEFRTFKGHSVVYSVAFSSDGKTIVSEDLSTIKLWDVTSGKLLKKFRADDEVSTILPKLNKKNVDQPISPNGRFQIKRGENGKLNLFEVKTGRLLASLIALDENDWAVVTPDGLFDASLEARKLMHYVIGLEPIALEQMKDLYYVPGLLQKIFKEEPLPKVELFSKKDLFPDVQFSTSDDKNLTIKLKNRGGGIGQVQVVINGKEFVADARPVGFDSNSKEATLKVSLKDAPFIDGEENKIEVVARNSAGSLSNRGTPRGVETFKVEDDNSKKTTPNIYAIIGGVSDYTGNNLDLSFAAKDAEQMAKAIELGATKLLGDKSKVHIRLLTSNGDKSKVKFDVTNAKISTATKADFKQAFADFSKATPNDVFIVYLAGHGVSLNLNQNPNQAGGDTYLYLTQEATTTDKSVLSLKKSREAMSVSSEELKELMKQNKALKQVLILDTCAAGALSNSLIAKRDLPSDQIRAIERLKDNTGFYVLMGSAANAVSYEASQYGQGLLTYSLLQGMKGARLRENQFADINLLFGYAQEQVPTMAKNIGGIQRPLIITPDNSASFDIGKFTEDIQKQIRLSNIKSIILRPSLFNKEQDYDDLELTKDLQAKLREANFITTRGGESPLVFVDANEMPDAVKPSGSYIVKGDMITVTLRLIRNKKPFKTLTIEGKLSERERLIDKLVEHITEAAKPYKI